MMEQYTAKYTSTLYRQDTNCVKRVGNDLADLKTTLITTMDGDRGFRKGMIIDNETEEMIYQINNYI